MEALRRRLLVILENAEFRLKAKHALTYLQFRPEAALAGLLADSDKERAAQSALNLLKARHEGRRESYLQILDSPAPFIVEIVAEALIEDDLPSIQEAEMERILSVLDEDAVLRLGRFACDRNSDDTAAMRSLRLRLVAIASSPDAQQRNQAAGMLARLGKDAVSVKALEQMLSDADSCVQKTAVIALLDLGEHCSDSWILLKSEDKIERRRGRKELERLSHLPAGLLEAIATGAICNGDCLALLRDKLPESEALAFLTQAFTHWTPAQVTEAGSEWARFGQAGLDSLWQLARKNSSVEFRQKALSCLTYCLKHTQPRPLTWFLQRNLELDQLDSELKSFLGNFLFRWAAYLNHMEPGILLKTIPEEGQQIEPRLLVAYLLPPYAPDFIWALQVILEGDDRSLSQRTIAALQQQIPVAASAVKPLINILNQTTCPKSSEQSGYEVQEFEVRRMALLENLGGLTDQQLRGAVFQSKGKGWLLWLWPPSLLARVADLLADPDPELRACAVGVLFDGIWRPTDESWPALVRAYQNPANHEYRDQMLELWPELEG